MKRFPVSPSVTWMRGSQRILGVIGCLFLCGLVAGCEHESPSKISRRESPLLSAPVDAAPLPVLEQAFAETAVGAADWIDIGDRVRLEGALTSVSNSGPGVTRVGVDANVGSVVSVGPIEVRDRAVVRGIVQSATSLALSSVASISMGSSTGGVGGNVELRIPAIELGADRGDVRLEPSQTRTIVPGFYGTLALKQGSTVRLATGNYRFSEVIADSGSRIEVDSMCGPVAIFVRDRFVFRGEVVRLEEAGQGIAVAYLGSATAHVETSFRGSVVAPASELVLGSATHLGRFFAKRLRVLADARIVVSDDETALTAEYCSTTAAVSAAGPYCEFGLCCPSPDASSHPQLTSACNVNGSDHCVVGTGSSDFWQGRSKIFFGRGGNDMLADRGVPQVFVSGSGEDTLCLSTTSVGQGGAGDDRFRVTGTGATLLPGGGRDRVELGPGANAKIYTFDACELDAGDSLHLAEGAQATLYTQLTREQILARGVALPSDVSIILAPGDRCMSDCAGAPICAVNERCIDSGPAGMRCEPRAPTFNAIEVTLTETFPGLTPEVRESLGNLLRKISDGDHLGLAPDDLRARSDELIPALTDFARTAEPSAFRNACIEALGSLYVPATVSALASIAVQPPPFPHEPYPLPHTGDADAIWFGGTATAVKWLRVRSAKGDSTADAALLDVARTGPPYAREAAAQAYLSTSGTDERRAILAAALPADSQHVLNLESRRP